MKHNKVRRQRPIKGGRDYTFAALENRIYRAAEKEASAYGVSKSWLIATILADALGVDLDKADRYDSKPEHVMVVKFRQKKAS